MHMSGLYLLSSFEPPSECQNNQSSFIYIKTVIHLTGTNLSIPKKLKA
jgi:hypothetical protein